MQPKHFNYIRSFRRSACLSQKELAWLTGSKVHTGISRFETFQTMPDVRTAFEIAFVFGVPLETVYPKIVEDAEDEVARRAYHMLQLLESADETVDVLRKREVLSRIPRRGGQPNTYPTHDS